MTQLNVSFTKDTVTVDRNGFSKTTVFQGENTDAVADAIIAALNFNADKDFVKKDSTRKRFGI